MNLPIHEQQSVRLLENGVRSAYPVGLLALRTTS
jgi:hypothetical protein